MMVRSARAETSEQTLKAKGKTAIFIMSVARPRRWKAQARGTRAPIYFDFKSWIRIERTKKGALIRATYILDKTEMNGMWSKIDSVVMLFTGLAFPNDIDHTD